MLILVIEDSWDEFALNLHKTKEIKKVLELKIHESDCKNFFKQPYEHNNFLCYSKIEWLACRSAGKTCLHCSTRWSPTYSSKSKWSNLVLKNMVNIFHFEFCYFKPVSPLKDVWGQRDVKFPDPYFPSEVIMKLSVQPVTWRLEDKKQCPDIIKFKKQTMKALSSMLLSGRFQVH